MNFTAQIGLAPALTKFSWSSIREDTAVATSSSLTLIAARNEVTGFQIQLQAPTPFTLTLDHSNWLDALADKPRLRLHVDFPQLPEGAVELFSVGYLQGDGRIQWQDTFDRCGWADVPAYRPHSVYVRLRIPAELPAGGYEGQINAYTQTGFNDEEAVWGGRVTLKVYDVQLPDVADYSFHLDLWQHYTAVARQHRVPLWSDAHFDLIDRYCASLAQLGQKAISVIASEIPWSGQRGYREREYPSYLFEHAIIDVTRDGQGVLHFKYEKLDRLLAIAAKHGIDHEIEIFGLLNIWQDEAFGFGKVVEDAPDAIRIRCFDEASGTITYLRQAKELVQFISALHDHLQQVGLLDRVRILADEPGDLPLFNERLAFVQGAAPGFKVKVAINHFEFMEDAPAELIDCVPVLPLAARNPQLTAQLAEQMRGKGGKMHWYVCCNPPIPNTFLHSPLVEGQLHGWLTYYLKLDGFLRWNFCLYPDDPWQRASWRWPHWPAGDMFFVLPGRDGYPVETLRYEALRTAVQDYELLKLAERTLPEREFQTALDAALAHILKADEIEAFAAVATTEAETLYSVEPEDYSNGRRVILDALITQISRID